MGEGGIGEQDAYVSFMNRFHENDKMTENDWLHIQNKDQMLSITVIQLWLLHATFLIKASSLFSMKTWWNLGCFPLNMTVCSCFLARMLLFAAVFVFKTLLLIAPLPVPECCPLGVLWCTALQPWEGCSSTLSQRAPPRLPVFQIVQRGE